MRDRIRTTIIIVVLLLVGCSSPKMSAPAVVTPVQTTVSTQTDQAAAGAVVLRTSDFPSGWVAVPHDSSADGKIDALLASCLHVQSTVFSYTAFPVYADAPDVSMGNGATAIQNSVKVSRTSLTPTAMSAVVESKLWLTCLSTAFGRDLFSSGTGGSVLKEVSTTRLDLPNLVDMTISTRTKLSVASHGVTAPLYVDVIVMRKGRAILLLTFLDTLMAFDVNMEQQLITIVAKRAETALLGAS